MIRMEKKLSELDALKAEIDALKQDSDVKLADVYDSVRYSYKNELYRLRDRKLKGEQLRELGYTVEALADLESEYAF